MMLLNQLPYLRRHSVPLKPHLPPQSARHPNKAGIRNSKTTSTYHKQLPNRPVIIIPHRIQRASAATASSSRHAGRIIRQHAA